MCLLDSTGRRRFSGAGDISCRRLDLLCAPGASCALFMQWLSLFRDDPTSQLRITLARRSLGLFGLTLVAATWRLWTPQHDFPQVPWLGGVDRLPPWCQSLASIAMVVGLLGAVVAPSESRWTARSLLLFAAGMLATTLFDQSRLQPWAYQFALAAVVLALAERREAIPLLRLLVISFYLHSALTKLDYSFLHTLGQQFLSALCEPLGMAPADWSERTREYAAAVFPIGELFVAIGLCFGRTRPAALVCAVLLHLLLLLILGPWGLQHRNGVLIWNLYFIVQDILLFSSNRLWSDALPAEIQVASPGTSAWFAGTAIGAAVMLPFLATSTWFDIWPSWGLYASCAERVHLIVHRATLEQLPEELHRFVESPVDADDPWLRVRVDRWALEVLGAPIYPQNRSQLGVAEALIVRYGLMHRARVVRMSLADRFTGEREYQIFTGPAEIAAHRSDYFFNSRPNQLAFAAP
jgi:hypothetical protein